MRHLLNDPRPRLRAHHRAGGGSSSMHCG